MSKVGETCEAGHVICERVIEQVCDACTIQEFCKFWNPEQSG